MRPARGPEFRKGYMMTQEWTESLPERSRPPEVANPGACGGEGVSDEQLVRRSLEGEEDAFRSLYERYRRPVYGAVRRILGDPEDSRDATQEIFLAVYRSLAQWNPEKARFGCWIRRVATNRAIDHWRCRRRGIDLLFGETPGPAGNVARPCPAGMRPAEKMVECRERALEVRRFLERLPQPQGRFVVLRYCEGLKLREIAEREGCRLGTVKSTLHRVTREMRRKLKRA